MIASFSVAIICVYSRRNLCLKVYVYRYAFIMVGNIDVSNETAVPNMTDYDYKWFSNDLFFWSLLKAKRKEWLHRFSVAIICVCNRRNLCLKVYVYRYAFIMVGNIHVGNETTASNMTDYDYEYVWLPNDLCFRTLCKAKRKERLYRFFVMGH